MTKLEKLRDRYLFAPHGTKAGRWLALRDETRRQLGYGRALRKVMRQRTSQQGGQHGR